MPAKSIWSAISYSSLPATPPPHTQHRSVNLKNMSSLWNSSVKYCPVLTCSGRWISYCRKPEEILLRILAEIRDVKRKHNRLKDGFEPWAEIRRESCSFASFITRYNIMIKGIYKTQVKKEEKSHVRKFQTFRAC